MSIVYAPTRAIAETVRADVTVEAEYGDYVALGTVYTAAHHQQSGPFAGRHLSGYENTGRPSPCNDPNIPKVSSLDVVLVSHVDLDSIGGALRTMLDFADLFDFKMHPDLEAFWERAEQVDVTGAHKLEPSDSQAPRFYAVWNWIQKHRPKPPTELLDVTIFMTDAGEALRRILVEADPDLLEAGRAFHEAEEDLNDDSYKLCITRVARSGRDVRVIMRKSDKFVNHLYRTPGGNVADAVASLNTTTGAVTLSLAEPVKGVSCREVVQTLWGPDAGGHIGIAGSPRGVTMDLGHLREAAGVLMDRLVKFA